MSGIELDGKARALLDDIFDKWSLLVLDRLCDGSLRFAEIRRELPMITPKSLTSTLRRLERNGIVSREVVTEGPVAVQYSITALGRSLEDPLKVILCWVVDTSAQHDVQAERPDRVP